MAGLRTERERRRTRDVLAGPLANIQFFAPFITGAGRPHKSVEIRSGHTLHVTRSSERIRQRTPRLTTADLRLLSVQTTFHVRGKI